MTNDQYKFTQELILQYAKVIRVMPLEQFIDAINLADTAGVILDPTAWMKGEKAMHQIKHLAEALLGVKRIANKIIDDSVEIKK
jgi:hypothetical protein